MLSSFELAKVLIADDDAPTRLLLKSSIIKWGFEVLEAGDGEAAWHIIQKSNPQLIILDWLMPNLDGLALCQRIRSELNYYPYIIFLTQLAGTANIIKGFEAGADEFLIKPVEPTNLKISLLTGQKVIKYLNLIHSQTKQIRLLQNRIQELELAINNRKENSD